MRVPALLRGRSFRTHLALIVFAGVLLRIAQTLWVAPWPPGIFNDEAYYFTLGKVVAHGHGFIQLAPYFSHHVAIPTAERPPLYPLALAGLTKLGLTGDEPQRLLGTLTGGVTIVLLALIARRLAGPRAGLAAAGIAALYPTLIAADGAMMTESLYGMLAAGTLLAALHLRDAPAWRAAAAFGALAGLAAMVRTEALLLVPLLLVPLLRRPGGVRAALVTVLAAVVVLAPWTIRNYHVFHRPVLVATEGGETLAGANCDTAYHGKNIGSWQESCVHLSGRGNEPAQFDAAGRDGVRYATHHLSRLPLVAAARLARTSGLWPFFQVPEGRRAWVMHIGAVVFFLLLPFAVLGWLEVRRRRGALWTMSAPLATVAFSTLAFYGTLRFRELGELVVVVLAGVGLATFRARAARAA